MAESQVQKRFNKSLFARGDTIVVAVSGGADSMVLLELVAALSGERELTVHAAHVNYGLRGEDSFKDEQLVRERCKALDVFAHIERTDALRAGSSNLEERARDIRYTFLRETAASIGARVIATGHNQDDQVETILLRLLRGSGLTGLIGMQAHQADLVRPLLELTRADIRHYAHAHKIPHRIDASNQDLRFVRNRVRRLLLPLLTKYFNPNLRETLTRSASLLAEDKSCLDDFTSTLYARLVKERRTTTGIEPSIDAAELTELPKALQRRLIRSMSKVADPQARLGHSVALEQALVALASHSKGVQFPLGGSLTLSRAKGTVRISFAK